MTRKSRLYKCLDYVKPAPVTQMTQWRGRANTVCDVLRRIYNKTDDEEIKLWARIATTMTRKMDYKLAEYAGGTAMRLTNKQRRKIGSRNKAKRRNTNKGKRAEYRKRMAS